MEEQAVEQTAEQDAYDAARGVMKQEAEANSVDAQEEQPAEVADPTVETPPETVINEQMKEMAAQVARIPELEKQLRDSGGRYGALKQSLEQLQQRIATATTQTQVAESSVDAKELLKDLGDEYPELAQKLEGTISKLAAIRQAEINPDSIKQILVAEREAEREAERAQQARVVQGAMEQLTAKHPDWRQVITTGEFAEWKETLSLSDQDMVNKSTDPNVAARALSLHKTWLQSRANKPQQQEPAKQPSKRLAGAVLPKSVGAPQNNAPSQLSEQEAYDKARSEVRRVRR